MRCIAVPRALVGVMTMALAAGIGFAPVSAGSPDASMAVPASPLASPWAAQSIVIVQLGSLGGATLTSDEVTASASIVESRLAALGVDARVTQIPDDRLRIDVADPSRADAVKRVATAPGDLQFVPVPEGFANLIVEGEPLPPDMPADPLFGGDSVDTFQLGMDGTGQQAIDIQLDSLAAGVFDDWAATHLGQRFAIVLDGLVVSAPVIRASEFDGRAQISGAFDVQQATELVAILQGGTLPVAAEVLTVCPATGDCPGASPLPSPGTGY